VTDTEALWKAVDGITKPSMQRLDRRAVGHVLDEVAAAPVTFCRVEDYRAATVTHGKVPSLWSQAEMALTTGSESSGGKPSPLATRSPADMDLMEIMLTIRESLSDNIVGRKLAGRGYRPKNADPQRQLRELAAWIVTNEPENMAWWAFRVEQWRRVLETYLRAVETGPKAMRLREPCPLCDTEFLLVADPNGGDDKIQVRPIVAIYRDHWFRCFKCEACTEVWWAGADIYRLHDEMESAMTRRETRRGLVVAGDADFVS
jgi:hypothetical protein